MSFFQRRWLSSARARSENIALQKQISKLLGLFLCAQPGKEAEQVFPHNTRNSRWMDGLVEVMEGAG